MHASLFVRVAALVAAALAAGSCCLAAPLEGESAAAAPSMNSFLGFFNQLGNKTREALQPAAEAAPKVPDASSISQEISKQTEGGFGSFFNKLSDVAKSAQESAQKALAEQQRSPAVESLQSGAQKAQEAAKSLGDSVQQGAQQQAQSGQTAFAAALSEIGKNLQTFAQSNPSLVPDVKKIYEKVSSKFSSSSSSSSAPAALPVAPATS